MAMRVELLNHLGGNNLNHSELSGLTSYVLACVESQSSTFFRLGLDDGIVPLTLFERGFFILLKLVLIGFFFPSGVDAKDILLCCGSNDFFCFSLNIPTILQVVIFHHYGLDGLGVFFVLGLGD